MQPGKAGDVRVQRLVLVRAAGGEHGSMVYAEVDALEVRLQDLQHHVANSKRVKRGERRGEWQVHLRAPIVQLLCVEEGSKFFFLSADPVDGPLHPIEQGQIVCARKVHHAAPPQRLRRKARRIRRARVHHNALVCAPRRTVPVARVGVPEAAQALLRQRRASLAERRGQERGHVLLPTPTLRGAELLGRHVTKAGVARHVAGLGQLLRQVSAVRGCHQSAPRRAAEHFLQVPRWPRGARIEWRRRNPSRRRRLLQRLRRRRRRCLGHMLRLHARDGRLRRGGWRCLRRLRPESCNAGDRHSAHAHNSSGHPAHGRPGWGNDFARCGFLASSSSSPAS
mmetsp:Transcript_101705/g.286751  ORF Transcript_101705/g.286751 Transcript_101705/m.286751 type:complete len:338 (-) Transcript_101705:80-1093(-)